MAAVKGLAIPRIAEPEEIRWLMLFVVSDEASFSTGSEFIADGGHLLRPAPQHKRAEAAEPSMPKAGSGVSFRVKEQV